LGSNRLRAVAERGLTLAVECDLPNSVENFILPLLGNLGCPSAVANAGSEPCRHEIRIVFRGTSRVEEFATQFRHADDLGRRLEIAAGELAIVLLVDGQLELLGERGHRVESR